MTKTKEQKRDKSGRVLRSSEDRDKLVSLFLDSGLSQVAFCLEHGLKVATFNTWYNKYRTQKGIINRDVFKEVVVCPPSQPQNMEVRVRLLNGVEICVPYSGSSDELLQIVRSVSQC